MCYTDGSTQSVLLKKFTKKEWEEKVPRKGAKCPFCGDQS